MSQYNGWMFARDVLQVITAIVLMTLLTPIGWIGLFIVYTIVHGGI